MQLGFGFPQRGFKLPNRVQKRGVAGLNGRYPLLGAAEVGEDGWQQQLQLRIGLAGLKLAVEEFDKGIELGRALVVFAQRLVVGVAIQVLFPVAVVGQMGKN